MYDLEQVWQAGMVGKWTDVGLHSEATRCERAISELEALAKRATREYDREERRQIAGQLCDIDALLSLQGEIDDTYERLNVARSNRAAVMAEIRDRFNSQAHSIVVTHSPGWVPYHVPEVVQDRNDWTWNEVAPLARMTEREVKPM